MTGWDPTKTGAEGGVPLRAWVGLLGPCLTLHHQLPPYSCCCPSHQHLMSDLLPHFRLDSQPPCCFMNFSCKSYLELLFIYLSLFWRGVACSGSSLWCTSFLYLWRVKSFSNCSTRAELSLGRWDLVPGSGIEPTSPASDGEVLTTGPPGSPPTFNC